MTARSGYLLVNSNNTGVLGHLIRNSALPLITYGAFLTNPGTITHIELPMWRTGTPTDFDVYVWKQNTGDPYTKPSTSNNWEIVANATVNAASVTGTSEGTRQRILVPVNTPKFLEDFPRRTDLTQDYHGYAFGGYAITIEQTTAQSNDSATNNMNIEREGNAWTKAPHISVVNSSRNFTDHGFFAGAMMFGFYGHYTVSSVFKDFRQTTPPWPLSSNVALRFIAGVNSSAAFHVAARRTAVGSKITRATWFATVRGNRAFELMCNIYTVAANTLHPDTLIGSSSIVNVATLSAAGYMNGIPMALHFVFSGGVSITSGTEYFFSLAAVNSVEHAANSYWIKTVRHSHSVNTVHFAEILPQTAHAAGNWAAVTDETYMVYWYVDSITQDIYDTDYPSAPPSSGDTDGDQRRLFPGAAARKFPTFIHRSQFRP